MSTVVAIAYVPVLHKGYLQFIEAAEKEGADALYLIGDDLLQLHGELDYLNRKDRLRALPQEIMKEALGACVSMPIFELTHEAIAQLQVKNIRILAPKEDVSSVVIEAHLQDNPISYKDVFLRWHKENLGEEKKPDVPSVTLDLFQQQVMDAVLQEASKSTDWWRQVGAALVQEQNVVAVAHNEHLPEEQLPNVFGDVRALFKKGININFSTAAHAEVVAIAQAAKQGIKTDGATLFITDFPCPYCARLIAKSGIKRVYFIKGYAVLEGDTFLRDAGIEVFQIEM